MNVSLYPTFGLVIIFSTVSLKSADPVSECIYKEKLVYASAIIVVNLLHHSLN